MAIPYSISANGYVYSVVDDCSTVFAAVITGNVTDEIMGDFNDAGFTVATSRNDLATRAMETGLYAVTAYPDVSFPQLASTSYIVNLTLSAPGFRDQTLPVTIPQNAVLPVTAPPVALRRLPVRIQGRVVNQTTRAPIAGALILSIDNPLTPPTVHTILLRSPLYGAHASGTQVQLVNLTIGTAAQLTADAPSGNPVLNLSIRTGLGANSVLQLSDASNGAPEYGVVDHLGPGNPNQPGTVILRWPLNRTYLSGAATQVRFVTANPTGAPAQLQGDANAPDGVLLATQSLNGTTLAVDPATPAQTEYHEIGALSDTNGYYAVSGVGRIKEIFLQASQGPSKSVADWFIEFERPVNVVDFRL